MYKKILPLLGICFVSHAYVRQLTNAGTIPITVTISYVACGDTVKTVHPGSTLAFDSGGCCQNGVTLSAEGFPSRSFGLDDNTLFKTAYDMSGTGAGMACKNTRFLFWNNNKTNTFETPVTEIQSGASQLSELMINGKQLKVLNPRILNILGG